MNSKYTEMAIKTAIGVLALLVLFLIAKTVTEVISWSKDEMYPSKTITVNATGEVMAVADIASFSFSVDEEGNTSEEAQKKSADKINSALNYLKTNGVDEKDIKTENYSIYPKYESSVPCYMFDCPPPTQKIVGYTVSQSVRVKVRDIDNAGKFLVELTKLQINNVSGISFTIDDEEKLYDEARADAIAKAQAKAETLAKELNVKLGDVVTFGEDNPQYYAGDYGMGGAERSMMIKGAIPEIPQGENKYTTRVYVTYELK